MTTSDKIRSGAWCMISASACVASGTATTSYPREDSKSCIRLMVFGLSSTTRIRGRRRRGAGSLAPELLRKEMVDNFLGKSITGQLLNRIVTKTTHKTTCVSRGPRLLPCTLHFQYLQVRTRSNYEGCAIDSIGIGIGNGFGADVDRVKRCRRCPSPGEGALHGYSSAPRVIGTGESNSTKNRGTDAQPWV